MGLTEKIQSQKEYFETNVTKDVKFRKNRLQKLRRAILKNERYIYQALKADLNKSEHESYITEVGAVLKEINKAVRNLEKWMGPAFKMVPLALFPGRSYVLKQPYGVVLILSPWNYPFQLSMMPLIGAIAAGNCVILKTSRSSRSSSEVMAKLIAETFDECYVTTTDIDEDHDTVLSQSYDYVFYTGSENGGREVVKAAAETLTPFTLELGGKNPCFVHKNAKISLAAKRIVWAKMLNSGQTCVAPDYLLVHKTVKESLIKDMKEQIRHMYGEVLKNPGYTKIINNEHFQRLSDLLVGKEDVWGGERDVECQKIAPAIMDSVDFESEIMRTEIFGPILPIITYDDDTLQETIDKVKGMKKPLACYVFTENREFAQYVVGQLSFGGGCINDAMVHVANDRLPFGGVGESGIGKYHGKYSFDTFSHEQGIQCTSTIIDAPFRYPPYSKAKKWLGKKFL